MSDKFVIFKIGEIQFSIESKVMNLASVAKSIWSRILAFTAALLCGLIFVLGSLRAQFFGMSYLDYLITVLGLAPSTAQIFSVMMMVASYAGWIILAAAVLIIVKKDRIAKIILFIVIGTGLISFLIPVIAAIASNTLSLEILLNGDATIFLVATLFGIIAKLYLDKLT